MKVDDVIVAVFESIHAQQHVINQGVTPDRKGKLENLLRRVEYLGSVPPSKVSAKQEAVFQRKQASQLLIMAASLSLDTRKAFGQGFDDFSEGARQASLVAPVHENDLDTLRHLRRVLRDAYREICTRKDVLAEVHKELLAAMQIAVADGDEFKLNRDYAHNVYRAVFLAAQYLRILEKTDPLVVCGLVSACTMVDKMQCGVFRPGGLPKADSQLA